METEHKSFIEELRSLSEPTKRKVLFGAVVISMVLVIYFWLAYFNSIVPSVASVATVQPPDMASTSSEGSEISGLFADTAGLFWQSIEGGIRNAAGALKNPRQYNISPK
jgi:hypothetical protein